jgi:hypothetical protein
VAIAFLSSSPGSSRLCRTSRCPQCPEQHRNQLRIDPVDVDLQVQETLDRSALVPDGSDVRADTQRQCHHADQPCRTWAEHDAALGAALMASGVIDVRDNLQVTG